MQMKRRDFLRLTAMCGGATALDWTTVCGLLQAKDLYPSTKIAYICHTQPGSGFDIVPRGMAPFLSKYLKQLSPGCRGGDIIMKNIPTAAGLLAYSTVLRGAPNGYTIGGLDISFITDIVTGKVDFDIMKFTYLAKLQSTNKVVIAHKNGFKTWAEALEASKKAPLKIGVGQHGRTNHITGIVLKEALDFNAKFINAQSTAGNMSMLIRGDVQLAVASDDSVSNLLQSKEVHALLTFNETGEYPGVVSMKQLGHPETAGYGSSHRFFIAPPKLPKDITALLINSIKKTLADKEFQSWAKKVDFAFDPVYGADAVVMANKYIQFYQKMEPILRKYLS
jgi:tripartite-type tricarboxylate transporter receptor subunit TctC